MSELLIGIIFVIGFAGFISLLIGTFVALLNPDITTTEGIDEDLNNNKRTDDVHEEAHHSSIYKKQNDQF